MLSGKDSDKHQCSWPSRLEEYFEGREARPCVYLEEGGGEVAKWVGPYNIWVGGREEGGKVTF